MSKKSVEGTFQSKISRNDRFVQMSYQEKLIEQKKKEIQAKLEAKDKNANVENKTKSDTSGKQCAKSSDSNPASISDIKNLFSNDGSFLNQFRQMKEAKKVDSKFKSFNKSKGRHDKMSNDERSKSDRWTSRRRSPSPKDRQQKRLSRFDKGSNFEPKITINTSFSSSLVQPPPLEPQINFEIPSLSISTQDVTGQPLLKNVLPKQTVSYQNIPDQTAVNETVISASPVLLNVPPPPQLVQSNTLILNPTVPTQNMLATTPILATVNLPPPLVATNITPVPPPCLPTIELANIPPPNPIQIQNIPQPEPLNAMNIPQPAPIQVQNIPTPTSLQLNKIPTPKPLDLLSIPTPGDESISNPDFIRNIPPPNKSVPPPLLQENQMILPHSQTITATITMPSTQNVLIHNISPPNSLETVQPTFSSVTVALPVVVGQVSTATAISNTIPSLMARPILPPPGMVNVNVSCPPPLLPMHSGNQITTFVNQPPPISQIGRIHLPPPGGVHILGALTGFKEENVTVFPTGTPEYEAMTSLGRMVAECGDTFEDVVRQRKEQDPRLWFLFDKESTAYKEYRQCVKNIKNEIRGAKETIIKAEDIYEPEMALEECEFKEDHNIKNEYQNKNEYQIKNDYQNEESFDKKRKRRSRWGNQETAVAPPVVMFAPPIINTTVLSLPPPQPQNQGPLLLTKITRADPGLIQYAMDHYGTTNLSEEDWKKTEDNYKVSLLYQAMVKKREEVERLKMAGKNKYEYDSDEEIDGGTWEHKAREKEMVETQIWAQELTQQAEGKHHIGDFLPPEELKKFMEKATAIKEGRLPSHSDYKEFEIKEDNIGFKMLQKLGWSEGEGLGTSGSGIVEPVNKGAPREHTQGLGLNDSQEDEDEYQSYRKRMMLAYRFRPNPLNNPRRPYY